MLKNITQKLACIKEKFVSLHILSAYNAHSKR